MTDFELKRTIINALQEDNIAVDKITVKTRNGYVYVEGEVEYYSERDFIGKSLMKKYIQGLRGICNLISINSNRDKG